MSDQVEGRSASAGDGPAVLVSHHPEVVNPSNRLGPTKRPKIKVVLMCLGIFLLAVGVRLLRWQDTDCTGFEFASGRVRVRVLRSQDTEPKIAENDLWVQRLVGVYDLEAERMVKEGGILYPNGPINTGDASMITHPPGYSILIAMLMKLPSYSPSKVRLVNIVTDAFSAVMVFLIAAELLPTGVAVIAGSIAAISPHLSYYSLWLSPDSPAVLPILGSVFLLIRAMKRPGLLTLAGAGALIGLSCWLRANSMLLAPFLAAMSPLLFERGMRLRGSAAIIGAMLLVISPITIRNFIVFHHFIPLSVTSGLVMVEGIGTFDEQGRFAMPLHDGDVRRLEAILYNKPEYQSSCWVPDGIERDQARFSRAVDIIRANPGWFLGAMMRRIAFMLSYNDSSNLPWPRSTAHVDVLLAEPLLSDAFTTGPLKPLVPDSWVFIEKGNAISPETVTSIGQDPRLLRISADSSDYGDQFASGLIPVKKNTSYLLRLPVCPRRGHFAIKVTRADRRRTLASDLIPERDSCATAAPAAEAHPETAPDDGQFTPFLLTFSSKDEAAVRIVLSNNGIEPERPLLEVGQPELLEGGTTPFWWTRKPRALLRMIQKNLYLTRVMVPLIIAGIVLLAVARRRQALIALLAVPAYYLVSHSIMFTEYRYILTVHFLLAIMASVGLYYLVQLPLMVFRSTRPAPSGPGKNRIDDRNPPLSSDGV